MAKTTTGERLVKIETSLDYLTEKIDHIAKDLKDHIEWEADKYEEMDKKFASKWVEKVMYGFVAALITVLLGAIITGALN